MSEMLFALLAAGLAVVTKWNDASVLAYWDLVEADHQLQLTADQLEGVPVGESPLRTPRPVNIQLMLGTGDDCCENMEFCANFSTGSVLASATGCLFDSFKEPLAMEVDSQCPAQANFTPLHPKTRRGRGRHDQSHLAAVLNWPVPDSLGAGSGATSNARILIDLLQRMNNGATLALFSAGAVIVLAGKRDGMPVNGTGDCVATVQQGADAVLSKLSGLLPKPAIVVSTNVNQIFSALARPLQHMHIVISDAVEKTHRETKSAPFVPTLCCGDEPIAPTGSGEFYYKALRLDLWTACGRQGYISGGADNTLWCPATPDGRERASWSMPLMVIYALILPLLFLAMGALLSFNAGLYGLDERQRLALGASRPARRLRSQQSRVYGWREAWLQVAHAINRRAADGRQKHDASDGRSVRILSAARAHFHRLSLQRFVQLGLGIADRPSTDSHCAICLADYCVTDGHMELYQLPCCHTFHTECIESWLIRGTLLCPLYPETLSNIDMSASSTEESDSELEFT